MVGRRGSAAGGAGTANFLLHAKHVYTTSETTSIKIGPSHWLHFMRRSPRLSIVIAIETPRILDIQ